MKDIAITLNHDEALVLFEWLASLDKKTLHGMYDESEQKVLWRIEGQLESLLPDIVFVDYKERVTAAKSRI